MVSPTLHQLVQLKTYFSSSSSSDDDYEDSVGPLPVLMRNKSLFVRRAIGTARNASGQESGQMLAQENKHDSTSNDLILRDLTRIRSVDTPPSYCIQTHRNQLTEASFRLVPTHHLPCRPRQTLSLQASHSEQYEQITNRVSSVQPDASRLKRPDPPELIRPVIAIESSLKEMLLDKSSDEKTTLSDHFSKYLRAPKRPARTASAPVFGRSTVPNGSRKPRCHHEEGDPIAKSGGHFSTARPSHSVAKSFLEDKDVCNDVWVERIVVRDGKSPQVFFKSVFSKECKYEPPTGAMNIIYLDELVKVQHLEGKNPRTSECKQEEPAPISPVIKRRNIWAIHRKGKKSPEESPSSRVQWWKGKGRTGESRNKRKNKA